MYVCVQCYSTTTLLFLGLIKGYAQLALHVRKFHLCYETNALGTQYVYGGWTKNRCMEVKLSLHALNSYSLVATELGMLL